MTPDSSPEAATDLRLARRVDVPVLITAPTRDAREMYARAIHRDSRRGRAAFVTLSARSLGAGPSASLAAAGEAGGSAPPIPADDGTLFIDDIVTLDAWGQARLLALLDERRFRIVGGASRHFDRERASGGFSETLFYRLNILHVDLTRLGARTLATITAGDAMTTPAPTLRAGTDRPR
jgi:two-component system NtrC family response regulator